MNEKVMGVFNQQGSKGTGHASTEDTSPTLGHCNTSVDVHAIAIDQQGGKGAASFAEGVAPTMAADSHGTPHAVAVRTANTHANGHGVADEATHTLDRASGQAVCVGFSHVASGMMLDSQPSPTSVPLKRSPGGEGAVCLDAYNQSATEESCMTLRAAMSGTDGNDADPKVVHGAAIGLLPTNSANARSIGAEEEVSPTIAKGGGESGNKPTVATTLKLRHTGSENHGGGQGAMITENLSCTLSTLQDQTLFQPTALHHIVRRLTPIECERLMALPDNYTRIPYRGKSADQCPDSPRYKALGNSWATNCAEWILRRIVAAIRLGMIGGNQ